MPVPTSGNFNMFGTANTTIQGAIVEGGGSAGAINNFNDLINVSNVNLFDPTYSGDLISVNQVNQSIQYRNYPKFFTAVTIGTNLGSGFSSSSDACTSSGSIATIYIADGGPQGLYSAFQNGKRLWSNTSLTTPFNGGNLWFKTTGTANSGDSFQVGTDGFISTWGGACIIPTTPTISCNVQNSYSGGISYPSEESINLTTNTGTVFFVPEPISIPDRFIVLWNNSFVIDTGYIGSTTFNFGGINRTWFKDQLIGKLDPIYLVTYPNFTEYPNDGYPLVSSVGGSYSFNKNLANPSSAVVRVYAPGLSTRWSYNLGCPGSGEPIV